MRGISAVKDRIDEERGELGDVPGVFVLIGKREGMPRIKEVLENHDWSMVGVDSGFDRENDPDMDSDDDLQDQLLGLGGSRGFDDEVHELEREMFGLRMAIERGGGDGDATDDSDHDGECEIEVESMEALMMRMQAIKDMSSELPEGERKRFAAKAVQKIMREL
ncbi:hypothetical protein PDIDSM_1851 [Penicillium digitatum]|nr:hypothetical protein PDIDSM_1851 [Penicillium digitatum]